MNRRIVRGIDDLANGEAATAWTAARLGMGRRGWAGMRGVR